MTRRGCRISPRRVGPARSLAASSTLTKLSARPALCLLLKTLSAASSTHALRWPKVKLTALY